MTESAKNVSGIMVTKQAPKAYGNGYEVNRSDYMQQYVLHFSNGLGAKGAELVWMHIDLAELLSHDKLEGKDKDLALYLIGLAKYNDIDLMADVTGRSLDGKDVRSFSPLCYMAIRQGDADIVKAMLDTGKVDINTKDSAGNTLLDEMYQRLIFDANADEGNKLSVEGKKRYFEIVKALEEKGAPVGNKELKAEFEKIRAGFEALTQEQKEGDGVGQKGARNDKEGEQKPEKTVDSKVKLAQELVRLLDQHSLSDDAKARVQELLNMKHPDEIDLNASYDFEGKGKWTALTLAALNKHEGVLKTLLEKGADVNVLSAKNRSALYYAAQSGSTEMVKGLLEKGADVNGVDDSNSTALHIACFFGNVEVVQTLLGVQNIDLSIKHKTGDMTPLDAVYQRLVLDAKADEGEDNKLSVEGKKRYFEIVKALEEKGAPVGNEGLKAEFEKIRAGFEALTQEQKEGDGVGQKGARNDKEGEQKREKTVDSKVELAQELVRLLDQHSLSDDAKARVQELLNMKHPDEIDLNASYDFGKAGKWTALTVAALNKHEGVLKTLLEKGADVNVLSTKNRSALYYAAQSGSTEMVKALLEKGANVNGVDDSNSTALHIACFFGNVEVVQTLLGVQNIDLGIKHKSGDMTPLDAVYQRLVLDAKADEGDDNKLSVEGKKRYFEIVKALEEKGAPVGNEGLKAEFEKIRAGLEAVTQEQKEGAGVGKAGARNDKEDKEKAESTEKLATILKAELDIAVSADKTQVEKKEALSKVREILKTTPEAGSNLKLDKAQSDVLLGCVNAVLNETRNLTGENVSHIQKACVALASKLTKEGAVTSAGLADEFMQREDESGHTRPELAAFEGRTDELAYYKSQGYDLNAVDPQNEGTLLHIAAVNGQTETVKWLLEKGDLSDEIRAKTSKNGNTALDSALNAMAQEGLSEAQKQNLRATAMALIEAKVGCKKEHEGTCETLIKQAQEVKKQKLNADLIALVKSGDLKDFEALIAKGADVNAVDQATVNAASGSKGRTVLDTVHDILNQDKLPDGKKLTKEQRSQYVDLAKKLRDPKASGGYQAIGNEVQLKDEIVAEINAPQIDKGSVGVDARKDIRRYNDESTQGRDAYKHAEERLDRMAKRSFKVHREVTMNAETQKTMLENIEKVLKAQGYEGSELENQSKMMLYKLAQANVLYHPNEFVSVPDENGKPQRKRANEVMRGNFRETLCVLAKKKYEELSAEQQQQIQTSLAGIEDAVSDEGYAILNVRSGQGRNYNTTKKAGYTTGKLSEKEQARLDAELFEAVEKGDVVAINKATARGANLNATREVEVEGKKVKQTPLDVAQEPKLAAGMRRAGAKTVAGLEKERLETEIKAFETLLGKEGLSAEEYTAAMKQLAARAGKVESAAEKSAVDQMIKMAADKAVAGSAFEAGFKASFADFDLAKHHADKGKGATSQQQGSADKGAAEQENAIQGKGDAVKQARNEAFASYYDQYKGENPSEKLKAVFDHFAQGDKEFAGDEKTKLLEALDHNSDGIINEGDIERTYAWIQSEKNNGK